MGATIGLRLGLRLWLGLRLANGLGKKGGAVRPLARLAEAT